MEGHPAGAIVEMVVSAHLHHVDHGLQVDLVRIAVHIFSLIKLGILVSDQRG